MSRIINVIGSIDWESFKEFNEKINELANVSVSRKSDIHVYLASDGGEVHAALAFSAIIRICQHDIIITAIGNVASAATLILATGDYRYMTRESWAMVHEDSGDTTGELAEREREIKHDRQLEDQWNGLMEKYTKTSSQEWEKLNKATTYLTAEDCLELGLIDKII